MNKEGPFDRTLYLFRSHISISYSSFSFPSHKLASVQNVPFRKQMQHHPERDSSHISLLVTHVATTKGYVLALCQCLMFFF